MIFPQFSASKNSVPGKLFRGLGNRCSVLLSYRGAGGFPRFLRHSGQSRTRETREVPRSASAQQAAQSVADSFPLPSSSRSAGQ